MKRITNERDYDDDGALISERHTIVDGPVLVSHYTDHEAGTHTIITREVRPLEQPSQFEQDADGYIDLGEIG